MRVARRWLLCLLAAPRLLAAQALPAELTASDSAHAHTPVFRRVFPQLDHPGAAADLGGTLHRLCPAMPTGRGELLKAENVAATRVRDDERAAPAWTELACLRALLDADGALGHDGPLMIAGTTWAQGAINAALRALALVPGDRTALGVLGTVALDEQDVSGTIRILEAVATGAALPDPPAVALRACDEFAFRVDSLALARRCADRALALGIDSTWHLLALSRELFRAADTLTAMHDFLAAVGVARSESDRPLVDWQVQWFLTPVEFAGWQRLSAAEREPWLRKHLYERDIRDGRPAGSRLAEHFGRLEYVLQHFVMHLARVAAKGGGLPAATPENPLPADTLNGFDEPGIVPARRFRVYGRWQTEIDDRGVVWMRFGAPKARYQVRPVDHNLPENYNTREAWVYEIDGQEMLLHFEGEDFDGTPDAARLVTGVLGTYLCVIDTRRCQRTLEAQQGRLHPENLENLRQEDQAVLTVATTKDDNSPRGFKNIGVASELYRLWDPASRAPIALVTYAVALHDLQVDRTDSARTVALGFEIRQLGDTSGMSTVTFTRHLALPDSSSGRSHLTGFSVVHSAPDVTSWSLVVTEDSTRRGRDFAEERPPIDAHALALSDLVLGAENQGVTWDLGRSHLTLAPLGTLQRDQPVHLYYQIVSAVPRAGVATAVTVFRTDQGAAKAAKPVLTVGFTGDVGRGITEVDRQLDLTQLDAGSYRLEVTLTDERGKVTSRQVTPLLLN